MAVVIGVFIMSTLARADGGNVSVPDDSVRFAQLVKAGDNARLARRKNEAFKAYNEALDIRRDPAVEGRMGLLILESGDYAWAAEYLLRAITKGQAPPYLMKQFHDAFARVRPKVCFVEVFVSEPDALVSVDGKPEAQAGLSAFHVFVTAGSHTFLAKREGFEDATQTIDVPAGGELEVRLDLKPLPPPPPVQVPPMPNPDPKPAVPVKPHASLSDSYLHFFLGAGPVLVLGAASSPFLGPQVSGGIRRKFVSVNLDARVSWSLTTPERDGYLRLVSWAVGVRPCAHHKILFGCGMLQLDGLSGLSQGFASKTRFGGGIHGGFEFVLRKPIHLQVWAEAVFRSRGYEVITDEKGLSIGSPVLGGFGATTFLTF